MLSTTFRFVCLGSFALLLAACGAPKPTNIPIRMAPNWTPKALFTSTPKINPTDTHPALSPTTAETLAANTQEPTSAPSVTLETDQPVILTTLHMTDEQVGWANEANGRILHTIDGGISWQDITPPGGKYYEKGFFALNANTAWATPRFLECYTEECPKVPSVGTVWRTDDAGKTWQPGQPFPLTSPTEEYIPLSLQFVDPQIGWLLVSVFYLHGQSHLQLLQTVDGGAHWDIRMDKSRNSVPSICEASGMAFFDAHNAWLGEYGCWSWVGVDSSQAWWYAYRVTNDGSNWEKVQLPLPSDLPTRFAWHKYGCQVRSVTTFVPNTVGLQMSCLLWDSFDGNPSDTSGSPYDFYYFSADGGQTWHSWLMTGDVDFVSASVGWRMTSIGHAFNLEQTRDGGLHWTKIKTVQWEGSIDFINEQVGWAIVRQGKDLAVVQTKDGGQTWQIKSQTSLPITATPASTQQPIPSGSIGWQDLGQLTPLWISSNAISSHWSLTTRLSVDPINPQRMAYCSTNEQFFTSSDSGKTWLNLPLFENGYCISVLLDKHPGSMYVNAVANEGPFTGSAHYTTDDGHTWQSVTIPDGYPQFGGFYLKGQTVQAIFARQNTGALEQPETFMMQQTIDGGHTWSLEHLGCPPSGPCVRWRPGSANQIIFSKNNGQTWESSSALPGRNELGELVALSPSMLLLLQGHSANPVQLSKDGGQTWQKVFIPGESQDIGLQEEYGYPQMLPDGTLLINIYNAAWKMLIPGASDWCDVPQGILPSQEVFLSAANNKLWWLDNIFIPNSLYSVPMDNLRCK